MIDELKSKKSKVLRPSDAKKRSVKTSYSACGTNPEVKEHIVVKMKDDDPERLLRQKWTIKMENGQRLWNIARLRLSEYTENLK